jgi:hypothetical protein
MQKLRIFLLACVGVLAAGSPSASQEFLLNCRLLTYKDPLFSQHCKSDSRCREGDCLLRIKKQRRLLKTRKRATTPQNVPFDITESALQAAAPFEDGAVQNASAPTEDTLSSDSQPRPDAAEANTGGAQPSNDSAAGSTEGDTGSNASGGGERSASSGAESNGSGSTGGDAAGSESGGSDGGSSASGGDSGGGGSASGGDSGGASSGGESGAAGPAGDGGE